MLALAMEQTSPQRAGLQGRAQVHWQARALWFAL
jgi:hypothetical protein